jgi:hypothetical protein
LSAPGPLLARHAGWRSRCVRNSEPGRCDPSRRCQGGIAQVGDIALLSLHGVANSRHYSRHLAIACDPKGVSCKSDGPQLEYTLAPYGRRRDSDTNEFAIIQILARNMQNHRNSTSVRKVIHRMLHYTMTPPIDYSGQPILHCLAYCRIRDSDTATRMYLRDGLATSHPCG